MNYNKKFNVGSASLAEPFFDYYHTLPLIAFGDVKGSTELSLVYNSMLAEENHFNIGNGFKLNLQKKLIINGTTIQLIDGNGMMVACNAATNGVSSLAGSAYALNDNSHRVLRRIADGYELEYYDFSKEIFDLSGKITKYIDKYNYEMLRYTYNSDNQLSSIIYRPSISTTYKVLTFDYDTDGRVSAITYSASGTTLIVGGLVYTNNDILINHYSGIDYNCTVSNTGYSVLAEVRNGTDEDDKKMFSCNRISNRIMFFEHQNLNLINSTIYDAVSLTDDNEILIIDMTDFQGVKTRMHYKNHIPCYIYELMDNNEMFLEDGTAKSQVQIRDKKGLNGVVSPGIGYRLDYMTDYSEYSCDLSAQTSNYIGDAIFCGWIQTINEKQCKFTINGDNYYVDATSSHEGQFFAIRFYNSNGSIRILNDSKLEIKDAKIVFLGKDLQEVRTGISNSTTLDIQHFKNIKFVNTTVNGDLISGEYEATFDDIFRYRATIKRNSRTNEFYYNNGRNLITDAGIINICYELRYSNGTVVKHYDSLSNFVELFNSICFKTDSKTEYFSFGGTQYLFAVTRNIGTTQRKQVSTYDNNMDLINTREIMNSFVISYNKSLETYVRNSHGLVTSHTIGEDITRQYSYNTSCTKLLSETDEFGTITSYTSDDVWGNITKASIGSLTATESSYTDDGLDLTDCTFGTGTVTTHNMISYADGNVSSLETAGAEYSFEYTDGDLTSIKKNGVALKNITYGDKYKTITVMSPTSSSASYSKVATTDCYGRELSISSCRTNEYALYPHFNSSNEQEDLGQAKGSASLKTTTDHTNSNITYYGTDENSNKRIITKNSSAVISSTSMEEDGSGRLKQKLFNHNTLGSIKDNIAYATSENTWETDNRVSNHQYSVSNQVVANNTSTYDDLKRPVSKKTNMNGIDFVKNIIYNKSRIASAADNMTISGATSNLSNVAYTYDALGRTINETDSKTSTSKSYVYDSIGRITRENNQELGRSYLYTYDSTGNVTKRQTFPYKTTPLFTLDMLSEDSLGYSTTHPDRLVSYNGKSITYDQQGCPLSYNNKTLTWIRGKLTKVSSAGKGLTLAGSSTVTTSSNYSLESCTFTYNGNGQRTQKRYTSTPAIGSESLANILTNETIDYTYDHYGRLIHEKIRRRMDGFTSVTNITYLYDCNTSIGIKCNSALYYFERNIQGDVVGVYDSTGTKVVTFKYDAFGRCTVSGNATIAQWCKIRYRGYYFDAETGLYWVQTRYYNPDWCRWISPDNVLLLDVEFAHGLNLYLYCGNDPINYVDPSGQWFETVFDLLSLGISIVEVIINPVDPWAWAGLAGDALDLVPFVTGVGETIKGVRVVAKGVDMADDALDTIKFMKATDRAADFADGGMDAIRGLDRAADGFTISNKLDGIKIHKTFMGNGELIPNTRLRADGLDKLSKTIFELKPYNKRSARRGIKQILNYDKALGGYTKYIIFY